MLTAFVAAGVALSTTCQAMSGPAAGCQPSVQIASTSLLGGAMPIVSPVGPVVTDIVLPSGVILHKAEKEIVDKFTEIVNDYPSIWVEKGFADLPEDNWMRIPLKADWEEKVTGKAKVYPLGAKDREFVDKTFDQPHDLGRLSWTNFLTPFSYPCFVVWKKQADGTRKGPVVVDVRGLNSISLPDAYPLSPQAEIIDAVRNCLFISVIDCTSFFYQWRVHPADRHCLTVVSHRGQESFNVAVMGYRNSASYVQRQINWILRSCRAFARTYIDDIVIFLTNFQLYQEHLQAVFSILRANNIAIKPTKAFIGYPSVQLLGQKVDSLGLATANDKLKAISSLHFPKTLRQLETYLGLIGWLREYVEKYARIAEPFTARKTALLKGSPLFGNARQAYSSKMRFSDPMPAELEAFRLLQAALSKPCFLVHHDPTRQLYIDVDASKESGIGGMLYHTKKKYEDSKYPPRVDMEPTMFLSRMLSTAESHYWPTELELAGLVWILRKTRHIVETAQQSPIVYIDHGAALGIAKQTTLSTSSTDKLNLRLVCASDYVQRFSLVIRHKPGKQHIMPDALSRLATDNIGIQNTDDGELDVLFTTSLVKMNNSFCQKVVDGYAKDPVWKKILSILEVDHRSELLFCKKDGLVYRIEGYTSGDYAFVPQRLCIPSSTVREIFEAVHDGNSHLGFARTYERIASSFYVCNLTEKLKEYLRHCLECQVHQTRQHKPYGSLQPVLSPPVPFHMLIIDFILALPQSHTGLDSIMSVTCKFSKRVSLVPGKNTWAANDWSDALLERLEIADWGLPKIIISDRDKKFLSQL